MLKLDKQIGGTISCNEQGIGFRGCVLQYICLVGCKIQPVDGYVTVCLVLTIDIISHKMVDVQYLPIMRQRKDQISKKKKRDDQKQSDEK